MLGWLALLVLLARGLVVALPVAAAWVVVTALSAGVVEATSHRVVLGAAVCLGVPLVLRGRVAAWLARRGKKATPPSPTFFVTLGNLAIATGLSLGFADDVGRALRRHGDWFVGERRGAVARHVRSCVHVAALYLETIDPVPELGPVILPPPEPPGVTPPAGPVVAWVHPLAGPERALPDYAIRRFGARRAPPRPVECELGHCGVDIGSVVGEPVYAIGDGVVDRANRNPSWDDISGIFVVLRHKDGRVRSRYIHLDSIEPGLAPGDTVKAGQRIGRLGRTGVKSSGPHLHFALSIRQDGHERFVDPEPYLRVWPLVEREVTHIADARR
jgi:murein DD-endopeptidase MepM/ murein hydrolase activator NlpD